MKTVLLCLVLMTGCCGQLAEVKQDNKELLLSLDNRYKQVSSMLANREKGYKKDGHPIPAWLQLQLATLPSWSSEVSRYKARAAKREAK